MSRVRKDMLSRDAPSIANDAFRGLSNIAFVSRVPRSRYPLLMSVCGSTQQRTKMA
jgi:hypothetical protein